MGVVMGRRKGCGYVEGKLLPLQGDRMSSNEGRCNGEVIERMGGGGGGEGKNSFC